jgi:hypothetical protein
MSRPIRSRQTAGGGGENEGRLLTPQYYNGSERGTASRRHNNIISLEKIIEKE